PAGHLLKARVVLGDVGVLDDTARHAPGLRDATQLDRPGGVLQVLALLLVANVQAKHGTTSPEYGVLSTHSRSGCGCLAGGPGRAGRGTRPSGAPPCFVAPVPGAGNVRQILLLRSKSFVAQLTRPRPDSRPGRGRLVRGPCISTQYPGPAYRP